MNRARLMERAQAGEREAFHLLFKDVGPLITGYLRRRISDNGEIEDISQDAMIAVYRSRHTYQPGRPFEPWLFAIVRKVTGEHFRRERERHGFQIMVEEMPEVAVEGGSGTDFELREALEQLSPTQMEALGLTKIMGLSVEEAAQVAGTSTGSIKVRV
ncbi:MAG TPA: RNA polymerase sigma factor, partial [Candidatus Binataceae bacterium]|nr:RNA polymerase sigma factor [Candidatus Binataceae bacterium]